MTHATQQLLLALAVVTMFFDAGATCTAAESDPNAILVGGDTIPASLEAVEPDTAIRFSTPSGERTIQANSLVRWGHPAEAKAERLVLLAYGSEIAGPAWAVRPREAPLHLENASLTFAPSLFEPVTVPRHLVRGIVLQVPADRTHRDRLLDQVRSYSAQEDAVLLAGGDRLMGRVTELDGDSISMETSLGEVRVPLATATAVQFDGLLSDGTGDAAERLLVGLSDGSLLAVREFRGNGDNLQMKLDGDVVLQGATAKDIVSLQPLGGTVTYLSDLEPHRYVHVPYLDLQWPLGRDRNVLGGRLRAGGQLFSKGLGVHSAARLIYRLDGSHGRFAARIAIDDSAGRGGSAIFRVLLAEGDAWREAYTSPVLRGGDEPVDVSVPLGEAKGLAIVVDYADRGDELDHADWLDARLE